MGERFEHVYSGQDLNAEMLVIVCTSLLFPSTGNYSVHMIFLVSVFSKCFSFILF